MRRPCTFSLGQPSVKSGRRRAEQAFQVAYTRWWTSEPDEDLQDAYGVLYAYQRRLWFQWWLESHNHHGIDKRTSPEESLPSWECRYVAALNRLRAFGDWLSVEVRFGRTPTAQVLRAVIAAYGDYVMNGNALLMGEHVMARNDLTEYEEEKGLLEPFLDEVRELGPGCFGNYTELYVNDVFHKCLESYMRYRVDDRDLLGYVVIDSSPCYSAQPGSVSSFTTGQPQHPSAVRVLAAL
jgi:hypothetical protein